MGRFRRVSSTRAGWSCAARARLESGGGRKRAGARLAAQTHSAGGCAGAGRRGAGAGYADARAGAVIILAAKSKKGAFRRKKIQKNAPRRIRTRARAFIYRRTRVFCLPRAGVSAYIAGEMAKSAKKTAPKTAAKPATAAELAPKSRKRGAVMARFGNRNAVGHGRPRGRSENAYVVKLNIAISRAQRERLETAAKNAGVKYTDFLRNFIDSL